MDRVQASDLINVFFSEYLRLYRIDLRADSIFLWMEREPGDAEGVGEFREPGGEPESFSAFVRAYARENVIPEYWENRYDTYVSVILKWRDSERRVHLSGGSSATYS